MRLATPVGEPMLQVAGVTHEPRARPRLGRGEDVADRERRHDARRQHALGGVTNEVTSGLHHGPGSVSWMRVREDDVIAIAG